MIRNYRGFTLVELLIVVALIAILAAVAGPRLTEYTVQGANASAAADLRNAVAAEKAFFADWGVYASSSPQGVSGGGWVWTSWSSQTGQIPVNAVNGKAPRQTIADPGFKVTLSDGVGLIVNTSAGGGSFTMVSKHPSGDRCFGMDSDTKEVYWVNGSPGQFLYSGSAPSASAGADDFSGIAGMNPCAGSPYPGAGQFMWVAL